MITPPFSPLSGTRNVVRDAVFSTSKVISDYEQSYKVDVSSCFSGIPEIYKWKCLDSGLSFFTPNTCAGGAEFYKALSRHDWYYMDKKWEYEAAWGFLPPRGRVLEVGCGHGHFLDQCVRRGYQAVGLELSPPESRQSKHERVDIFDESIGAHAETHAEACDALCSFQVLEHVPEPKPFLEACCKVLKRGAKLILCTPNADSFLRHSRTLLDMPPHHITGWREETFRYLERILPLRFERAVFEPLAEYHINFFVGTYQKKYTEKFDIRGIWTNEPFVSLVRKGLSLGARKLVRGQSILAVFTRI